VLVSLVRRGRPSPQKRKRRRAAARAAYRTDPRRITTIGLNFLLFVVALTFGVFGSVNCAASRYTTSRDFRWPMRTCTGGCVGWRNPALGPPRLTSIASASLLYSVRELRGPLPRLPAVRTNSLPVETGAGYCLMDPGSLVSASVRGVVRRPSGRADGTDAKSAR
jgi:hypothetical protein